MSPKHQIGENNGIFPDLITGLDINEDFVSDADSEDKGKMKKA